jgi:hypothetical protein
MNKYTWTCPDRNSHNKIDHILIDNSCHSSIPDVRSFRGSDCHSFHYLLVENVRERVAVSKPVAQTSDGKELVTKS